jgi:hypothetical protein
MWLGDNCGLPIWRLALMAAYMLLSLSPWAGGGRPSPFDDVALRPQRGTHALTQVAL